MINLKYNPLLKLNLQEVSDAEEIIGDGYDEKLLTWQDFLDDINNKFKFKPSFDSFLYQLNVI